MKDVFDYIVNTQTFYTRVFTNYNYKGTYLENEEYPWRGFFYNKKGVTFGKFKVNDQDKTRDGEGLIVSNDNFAYCGKISGDRYHGTGLYYDKEEGIQSGQLQNGYFTGWSVKTRKDGECRRGTWVDDVLVTEQS